MKIVPVSVDELKVQGITIGRRDTYGTEQVVFDLSELMATYGEGSAVLMVKRPVDETAYPATTEQTDGQLIWTVSNVDTAYKGKGECEIFWYVDSNLAKTVIMPTSVLRDIGETTEEPPDAYQGWVDNLTALGAETLENARIATRSAEEANQAAEDAGAGADDAEKAAGKAEMAAKEFSIAVANATAGARVTSLNKTGLESARVIETVGVPVYVDDVTQHEAYGITETGWYIFARIKAPSGVTVGANASVTGAAGVIMTEGADHIDVAIKFEVAAVSAEVTIDWGEEQERFVFKSTDLAIRNLDYRVTFYVYDIGEFCEWEYALTTDTKFVSNKYYYTKSGDEYTLAEVTVGDAIPADTYYVHSKVTIQGMTRNITYRCNTPIDCPVTFVLPEIEDETHGAWFECRFRFMGAYSITLTVPTGVKVATEHTQKEKAGINMVDLHYTNIDNVKLWRFMNTASTIPA